MKKRLKNILKELSTLDIVSLSDTERRKKRDELLIQIQFLQHERLIHLIVTITFALLSIGTILCSFFVQNLTLVLLMILFLLLLIPYVFHYYTLENGVQKLYEWYDKLSD